MAITAGALHLCFRGGSKPLSPRSRALTDLALIVGLSALGVWGLVGMTPIPPIGSYALLGCGSALILGNIIYHASIFYQRRHTREPVPEDKSASLPPPSQRSTLSSVPLVCQQRSCPTIMYTSLLSQELQMRCWQQGNTVDPTTGLPTHPEGSVHIPSPVASSADHLGVVIPSACPHHIIFDDGRSRTSIHIKLPQDAKFMKPSVDTMLVLRALQQVCAEKRFTHAIDVGAGTGFIAKYLASKRVDKITALDIDSDAISYMRTEAVSMPQHVYIVKGDALERLPLLEGELDLIVSNPPYVPTLEETRSADCPYAVASSNFWNGTGMISYLLEKTLPTLPPQGEIVLLLSSLSLKPKRVYKILQHFPAAYRATLLCMQEVAYKAWFAGNNQVDHLLAHEDEASFPTHFAGANLDLFVGITPPGKPRMCLVHDGRKAYTGYHWQVIYVISFSRTLV